MKILCSAELQEEHHVRLHEAVVYKPHLAEALLQTVLGWANTQLREPLWQNGFVHCGGLLAKVALVLQTVLGWANTIPGRTADTQRRLQAMEAPGRF